MPLARWHVRKVVCMNEHQLASFILAAERGSFSKAATESFITTSALVQQINLLEADLGFKLFVRKTTGVTLTTAGANFYETARTIVETMRASREMGTALERASSLELKVGCEHSEVADYLFTICEMTREAHPDLRFSFYSTETRLQPEALAQGKSDLFFAPDYLPLIEGIHQIPLYTDGYRVCFREGHPLAGREVIEMSDLAHERIYMEDFMFGEGTPLHDLLDHVDERNIDRTPFSVSLPEEVRLNNGVLPRLDRCSQHWCPPLVSVPLACRRSRVGVVCADDASEVVRWFVDAARAYFATQPNGIAG